MLIIACMGSVTLLGSPYNCMESSMLGAVYYKLQLIVVTSCHVKASTALIS